MISIYTTCKDMKEAETIAESLLGKRLIACSNLWPIKSHYWWKGKIEESNEFALLMKTRDKHFKEVEKEIKKIHSYDKPAIVCCKLKEGSKEYFDWIKKET